MFRSDFSITGGRTRVCLCSKHAVVAKETVSGTRPVFNGNLNPAFKAQTLEMEAAMFSWPLQGVSSPPGGSTEAPRPSVQAPNLPDLPSQMSSAPPPISLAVDTPPLPTANLLDGNEVCDNIISGHIIHWAHPGSGSHFLEAS